MFQFKNISDYQQSLVSGKTNCADAVNHYLEQIELRKSLNAYVHVFADEALERASVLDHKRQSGKPLGRLHGVVVSIKDVISYKDHPLSASSKMLSGFTTLYNATAVQRLLDEDAIIIGTCNCDEFAMGNTNEHSCYGPARNPFDESKVAGGSSGGSAAAVGAGLCMASLGSDTGGSVRQPADFCGVVGMKPSYGTISRFGLIAYASSFDQIGVFTNTVEDAGLILDVISGPDTHDSTMSRDKTDLSQKAKPLKEMRIGIFGNAVNHASLDREICNSIIQLSESLKGEVHSVESISLDLIDYIVPAYYILTTAEASSNLSRYDGVRYGYRHQEKIEDLDLFYKANRSNGFGWEVKKRIMLGTYVLSEGYFDAYFSKAQKVRKKLVDEATEILGKYDVVLLPTAPATAFSLGSVDQDPVAMYLADIFTVYANLSGIPAISLPLFRHSNGMPFGVQLLAGRQNEVTLLAVSKHLMDHHKQYS